MYGGLRPMVATDILLSDIFLIKNKLSTLFSSHIIFWMLPFVYFAVQIAWLATVYEYSNFDASKQYIWTLQISCKLNAVLTRDIVYSVSFSRTINYIPCNQPPYVMRRDGLQKIVSVANCIILNAAHSSQGADREWVGEEEIMPGPIGLLAGKSRQLPTVCCARPTPPTIATHLGGALKKNSCEG